jgi:hypothetical protein
MSATSHARSVAGKRRKIRENRRLKVSNAVTMSNRAQPEAGSVSDEDKLEEAYPVTGLPHVQGVHDKRAAIFSRFTAKEETRLLRKIDVQLSVMVGLVYLLKQVHIQIFPGQDYC